MVDDAAISGMDDSAAADVATPTVFRSFLEVAGGRITPSTLSKATLTDLSHTLEDLVLIDDAPGTVLTGFQESQHWHAERLRYEALAAGAQRRVAVFSQERLGRTHHEGSADVRVPSRSGAQGGGAGHPAP